MVRGGSDKFIGSDLEQRLKDRGIKTVYRDRYLRSGRGGRN